MGPDATMTLALPPPAKLTRTSARKKSPGCLRELLGRVEPLELTEKPRMAGSEPPLTVIQLIAPPLGLHDSPACKPSCCPGADAFMDATVALMEGLEADAAAESPAIHDVVAPASAKRRKSVRFSLARSSEKPFAQPFSSSCTP